MSMIRGALLVAVLAFLALGCSSPGGSTSGLDGTWLVDLDVDTRSDTGEVASSRFTGYELVIDQVGPSVLFAGVLGHVTGERIAFGSDKAGSAAEDGNWARGWWRVRTDGWAEIGEAEIAMRIEVWDSGGTEILGLHQQFRFTNFVKLEEPSRPTLDPP